MSSPGAAVQPVVAGRGEGHRVVPAAAEQHVVAGVVGVEAGAHEVVAGSSEHDVGVELPVHDVVAAAAVDDVAAGQRLDVVGPVVAEQGVARVAGGKPLLGQGQGPVVAAVDEIVAAVPRDDVTAPAATQ